MKSSASLSVESFNIYVLRSGPSWSNLKDSVPETSSSNTKQLTTNLLSDNNCSGNFWGRNYTSRSNSRFSITEQPHNRSCSTKSSTKAEGKQHSFFRLVGNVVSTTRGYFDVCLQLKSRATNIVEASVLTKMVTDLPYRFVKHTFERLLKTYS